MFYASDYISRIEPIHTIGNSNPIGWSGVIGTTGVPGPLGILGPTGITGYSDGLDRFRLLYDNSKPQKTCPICCGKGKVEKQGLFGIIKLAKCKCKKYGDRHER